MGNYPGTTRITNTTNETVQICLIDTNGKITDQKIESNSYTNIETPNGRNTINIISPIDDRNFQQCFTIGVNWPLLICKENGFLTIKRAKIWRKPKKIKQSYAVPPNLTTMNTEPNYEEIIDYDKPNLDHSDKSQRLYSM